VRTDKRTSQKADKKAPLRVNKRGVAGYSKKSALLEEAITYMNAGKYGRSSAVLKELLALDPHNTEARRLFATLHLRLGSLVTARQAFESLANEAIGRQDYWLAESLLREYLAAGPRCVPFIELLAHVYMEKGDEMAAVGELGKAIEILRDDLDSESPRKAAQLYAKLRELAPGSPIAIELASLFDVQTGEFLFHPSSNELPGPVNEATGPLSNDATSTTKEPSLPELIPWELSEDLTPKKESPVPEASAPVELGESKPAVDSLVQAEPHESELVAQVQESPVPSRELASPMQDRTASHFDSSYHQDEPTSEMLNQDRTVLGIDGEHGSSSHMPWEQMADVSLQILDAEPPSSPTIEFTLDQTLSDQKEDVKTSEESLSIEPDSEKGTDSAHLLPSMEQSSDDTLIAGPSPMPWEQVADATLQIPQAETSLEPVLASTVDSIHSDVREDLANSSPLPSSYASPGQIEDPSPVPNALGHTSPVEEPPASVVPSDSEPVVQPPAEISRASTFSWGSVFDSAWRLAAGTTASEIAQEAPPDGRPAESNHEQELATEAPVSVESDRPVVLDSSAVAEPTLSDGVSPPSHQSHQVIAERIPNQDEPLVDAEPQADLDFSHFTPSDPIPAESTSTDLPEFPTHSTIDRTQEVPVSPEMPVSFSLVADAQEVPEVESVQMDLPEPSVTPEVESTEPSPLAAVQDPVQLEEPPATEAAPQSVSETTIVADPQRKPELQATPVETPSHWNTGEFAVQLHRPMAKKKKGEKKPEEIEPTSPVPAPVLEAWSENLSETIQSEAIQEEESTSVEAVAPPVEEEVVPAPPDMRPQWMRASEEITFSSSHAKSREEWQDPSSDSFSPLLDPVVSANAASSAVDVLFGSTNRSSYAGTQDRLALPKPPPRFIARLHRVRIGVSSFVGACFSTTRSLTVLALAMVVMTVAVTALGIGALGVVWMAMEEAPSPLYQRLTGTPPRAITDVKNSGYFLLMGFDAPAGQDPIQTGYARRGEENDVDDAKACTGGKSEKEASLSMGASSHVVKGWFRSADPVGQLKGQSDTIKSLAAQEASSLARYGQWLTMPFDDLGYGQLLSPNCAKILFAHRLFILEGFSQDSAIGLNRLEADAQSWRAALGQSKTLMMKMLAVTALQDDTAMASALLSGSELDGNSVTRLSQVVRPLDQVELSLRWPMQSHFVWATQSVQADLRHDNSDDRPWYVSFVAGMRLPVQRRANAYAEYYEAVNKAVAAGRHSNLPQQSSFIRTPPTSVLDYVANPVENIVGIEPLPSWDPYVLRIMELDAQLRLVGLQAWIRRGPQDGDLLTRLAKAGQTYYDPFTGLPMLVNQRKGLIYSVGGDGKDQEGDRIYDIAVAVPSVSASLLEHKSSTTASPPR